MATVIMVDTLEIMDQDEEVALKLSDWIGGSDNFFHCLMSFCCQKTEGRGGLQYLFFVERHHWEEYCNHFWR